MLEEHFDFLICVFLEHCSPELVDKMSGDYVLFVIEFSKFVINYIEILQR